MDIDSKSFAKLRNVNLLKSAGFGAIAKVISVSTSLVTVPLTLNYLGTERFGIWMTITSLISFLTFADFGIGNGLISSVAKSYGSNDRISIKTQLSNAYTLLFSIGVGLLLLFGAVFSFVNWAAVFNVYTDLAKSEVAPAVAAMFFCFALTIPFSVVQRVQMGMQQTYIVNIWQCVSSIATLCAVYVAISQMATLPVLVLTIAGMPIIILTLNTLIFFLRQAPDLRPNFQLFSQQQSRSILKFGGLFFILQIVSAATYTSDNFIIAQFLGPDAVAEYAVTQKLFSVLSLALGLALAPLWPAYGEAIARKDVEWIRKVFFRSLIISVLCSAILSVVLVFAAPTLITLWIGAAAIPSLTLLVAFGVWKSIEAGGNAIAMFLNGAQIVKFQVIVSCATAVMAVALKIILIKYMGSPGVLWATSISYVACVVIPVVLYRKRLFKSTNLV